MPLLTTFGLSIVIQNLLDQGFSVDDRSLGAQAGAIATSSRQITSQLSIPAIGALTLGVAIVIYGSLQVYLSKTRSGRQMRATAQDPDTAELVGINSRAVYARATAIAVAIAAIGGLFLAIRSSFSPYTGPTYLIFAFEAVVIGGIGSSLWATFAGGIVLGIAQTIGGQINPEYPVLAGHLVFLAVLLRRAAGCSTFGGRRHERTPVPAPGGRQRWSPGDETVRRASRADSAGPSSPSSSFPRSARASSRT